MAIQYQPEKRIFTLITKHTTYQMQVDAFGFLLHLYYGKRIAGDLDYLLPYYDRGSGAWRRRLPKQRAHSA